MSNMHSKEKGSVLIMTLIITSGILVLGIELSMTVSTAIRLARNTDRAVAARYASESALESALHQLRRESRTTLRKSHDSLGNNATWSFERDPGNAVDQEKFNTEIPAFERPFFQKESTVQFSLYQAQGPGLGAIPRLKTIRISWEKIDDSCAQLPAPDGTPPGIETSIIKWNGGAINWEGAGVLKNFQQAATTSTMSVEVDLDSLETDLSQKPMLVTIKPYFCDLSGVRITLPDPNSPNTAVLNIPNYYLLRPLGKNVSIQQDLSSIVPGEGTLSDIFDFSLFSEDPISK